MVMGFSFRISTRTKHLDRTRCVHLGCSVSIHASTISVPHVTPVYEAHGYHIAQRIPTVVYVRSLFFALRGVGPSIGALRSFALESFLLGLWFLYIGAVGTRTVQLHSYDESIRIVIDR